MIHLNIPKLDEVIEEANKKGLKPSQIAKGIGSAPSTVCRYFCGETPSLETMEKIIEYINRQ
jgi:transcriptional regulator with XRE-family HTH domain